MKNRIGVIIANKERFDTSLFPDSHFHFATNVMDFYQIIGSQKPSLIVLQGMESDTENDLMTSLRYLRKKSDFAKTPILLLTEKADFRLKGPIQDAYLRAFAVGEKMFLKLIDFLVRTKDPESLAKPFRMDEKYLEESFASAMKKRMGLSSDFTVREPSDDERHASFFCQLSAEIPTSLFWVKFSVRILEEGNPAFQKMMEHYTDEERELMSTNLLTLIMDDFRKQLEVPIVKEGAVTFPPSDELEFEDRKAFVKGAKNRSLIFQSDVCCLLFESTQYI